MRRLDVRDVCLIGGGYMAGALLASFACLVCGWLDNREGK